MTDVGAITHADAASSLGVHVATVDRLIRRSDLTRCPQVRDREQCCSGSEPPSLVEDRPKGPSRTVRLADKRVVVGTLRSGNPQAGGRPVRLRDYQSCADQYFSV